MMRLVTAILVGLILIGFENRSATTQSYNSAAPSGVIGYLKAVNLNTTGDKPFNITGAPRYFPRGIYITGCTIPPTLMRLSVRTAASGGGTVIGDITDNLAVANGFDDPTDLLDFVTIIANSFTAQTLYVNVSVPQGAAMTCDIYLAADALP